MSKAVAAARAGVRSRVLPCSSELDSFRSSCILVNAKRREYQPQQRHSASHTAVLQSAKAASHMQPINVVIIHPHQ